MPELPEVTTITNQLKKEIAGSTVVDVTSVGGYKTQPGLREKAIGQKVRSVRRVAKNIVIELSNFKSQISNYVVIHLAMTGRLLLRQVGQKEDPWTRLVFKLLSSKYKGEKYKSSGSKEISTRGERELRFCDSRMFGFVRLMSQDELEQYSSKYGPDALDEKLTPEVFLNQLKKKKTEVKRALLEQELIAGAGNIYVNDSLWMAGIHPQTKSTEVTSTQAKSLLQALQTILKESIEHRGSTLGDKMYIDVYGREGEHQKYFRVFGKGGEACPRCKSTIEFIEIGGRGSFYCPQCQKKRLADNSKNDQPSLI